MVQDISRYGRTKCVKSPIYRQTEVLKSAKDEHGRLKSDIKEGPLQEDNIEAWLEQVNVLQSTVQDEL